MTPSPRGLRGEWQRDFDSWNEGLKPFFEQRDGVEVKILSWGPGEASAKYAKREEICRDLATIEANNVFTPEQLNREDKRFKEYDTLDAEEIQGSEADIVICLQVDDPKASGAPLEITQFEKHPLIAPRIRLIAPVSVRQSTSLLHEASRRFPQGRTFEYTAKQYKNCESIRATCRRWVDEVRRNKHLHEWRQSHSPG